MDRRMILLAAVLAGLVALSPGLDAQQLRMAATLRVSPDGLYEGAAGLCPQCREGAPVTLEFMLATAQDAGADYNRSRSFILGSGANVGFMTIGDATWPLTGNLVVTVEEQGWGSVALHAPSEAGPIRGPRRAVLHPSELTVYFHAIPLDGSGRLIAVNTTGHWFDDGNSHMSIVLGRGETFVGYGLRVNSVIIEPASVSTP